MQSGVPAIIDSGIEKGIKIVNTAWEAADVFSFVAAWPRMPLAAL
ncbi:hypothetical protein [Salmonella enterica]